MSLMASAASAYDEHLLRRVQSTGDLPDAAPSTHPRPADSSRRSEGSIQRPEPSHLPPRNTAVGTSLSSFESVLGALHDPRPGTPHSPSPRRQAQRAPQQRRDEDVPTLVDRLFMFMGLSGSDAKARRQLLLFLWNVGFSVAQYIIVITLLAYSAHHESPTEPGLSEWEACERPLGVWDSIWLVRVALGLLLSVWGYRRERAARSARERRDREDVESPRVAMSVSNRLAHHRDARTGDIWTNEEFVDGSLTNERPSLAYSRLSMAGTLMSLAWFLTAHILEYTSVNDCRYSSPHLWWLTFGILCILYLMVLEIFLLGLLVFVFGPVIYLLWNIVLLCLGRHPLQNPHQIKPEIGKLSKQVVDQIPLVLYIPPPPEAPDSISPTSKSTNTPITVPAPAYSYPPVKKPSIRQPKRRFAFFRKRKGKALVGGTSEKAGKARKGEKKRDADPEKTTWEERWEPGDYPFVRLEGNRAVCAICLLDFEPPKRIDGVDGAQEEGMKEETAAESRVGEDKKGEQGGETAAEAEPQLRARDESVHEVQVEEVTEEERDQLRLDDAGEGAVPLRLLGCGHVFHQTCVDPWLIDVSGRCPVCQRSVMEKEVKPKRRMS